MIAIRPFGALVLSLAIFVAGCGSDESGTKTAGLGPTTGLESGIGGTAVPGPAEDGSGVVENTVNFETDSYTLSDSAQKLLQLQADWLKQYPMRNFTVEGYADERGTREYNLGLGERRANSIANYLVALGVDKARISVISYGKERPVCSDAGDACWAQNRRGVTALTN